MHLIEDSPMLHVLLKRKHSQTQPQGLRESSTQRPGDDDSTRASSRVCSEGVVLAGRLLLDCPVTHEAQRER